MPTLLDDIRENYITKAIESDTEITGGALEFLAEVRSACADEFANYDELNDAIRKKVKVWLLSRKMNDLERKVANKVVQICEGKA